MFEVMRRHSNELGEFLTDRGVGSFLSEYEYGSEGAFKPWGVSESDPAVTKPLFIIAECNLQKSIYSSHSANI